MIIVKCTKCGSDRINATWAVGKSIDSSWLRLICLQCGDTLYINKNKHNCDSRTFMMTAEEEMEDDKKRAEETSKNEVRDLRTCTCKNHS